jgi:hypothetical protein
MDDEMCRTLTLMEEIRISCVITAKTEPELPLNPLNPEEEKGEREENVGVT